MTRGTATKVIAACGGLGGFSLAIMAGLHADNPADLILARALVSLGVCYVLGTVVGAVAERAIDEAMVKRGTEMHRKAVAEAEGAREPGSEPIVV